jgi:hypothetical protein
MSRSRSRRSKLAEGPHRRNDDADTLNGGWSREKLEWMDARFVEAIRRVMLAQMPASGLPSRKRRQTVRK